METNSNSSKPALLRRAEAQRLLSIGPSKYKELVGKGELKEVSIGDRGKRLPYCEIERYIAQRLQRVGGSAA